jgi:predicted Zn-dependent protease
VKIASVRITAVLGAVALAACATSPLGRSQLMMVSDDEMEQMGVQAFAQISEKTPQSTDAKSNAYVTCVAKAITTSLPDGGGGDWEVRVFQDDTANAFALPGRKIGVNTGLLEVAKNQDQLATVIGHEVAHVLAKHGAERVSAEMAKQGGMSLVGAMADPSNPYHTLGLQLLGVGVDYAGILPYSRTHESEADLYGLDLMASAGFDPRQSVPLWENMQAESGNGPPQWLSTHPSPDTRIQDLDARIPQALKLMEQARAQGRNPHCR